MSDEELVKHCMCGCIYLEAECPNCNKVTDADRIEALTKRLTAMDEQADKDMAFIGDYIIANGNLLAERDALEAKLAKAMSRAKRVTSFEDTTEELAECGCDRCKAHLKLRALLAEIEGEKG
jgi:hypothetical protein